MGGCERYHEFNRDDLARWYATQHLRTDPGIREVHYLKHSSPDREIRLLEVNDMMVQQADEALEPLDFGVDTDSPTAHKLLVMDVTPAQWERIKRQELPLPQGWTLDGATTLPR